MLNKILTTSSTAQIDIPKIATFGLMWQQPHAQLVHIIRDGLGGTAVRTRLIGIEPIPLSITLTLRYRPTRRLPFPSRH